MFIVRPELQSFKDGQEKGKRLQCRDAQGEINNWVLVRVEKRDNSETVLQEHEAE